MHVTVYGDSILKGVRMENGRYLVDREWERLFADRSGWDICNRSRFGCTLTKALAMIRHDLSSSPSGGFAVLELGGNDCDHDWASVSALCAADADASRADRHGGLAGHTQ